MSDFLSIIVFTLPGIVALLFVRIFGLNFSINNKSTETLIISLILWVPINLFVIGIYTLNVFIINDIYMTELPYISNFSTLKKLANSFGFILYYIAFSILGAYLLAKIISGKIYNCFLSKVNNMRRKNGKAPLSREPSVWDNAFTNNTAEIVRISNINNNDLKMIGEIKNVSHVPGREKDLLLRHVGHWTAITSEYEVTIEEIYFDTKTGCKIEIYDRDHCIEAQDLYLKDE